MPLLYPPMSITLGRIFMRMRVLTFNIRGWRTLQDQPNWARVAAVIKACRADVVGLNEVFHPQRFQAEQVMGGETALDWLAQSLGMQVVFGPCLRWPATDTLPEHSYGNALLCRWPIVASAAHHLTPVEGKEQRGLLEARILLPDNRPLTVYVTHLDHTDESARLIQLRAVRTWTVRDRNRAHLVMGDFNAIHPQDYAHRPHDLVRLAQHEKGANMTDQGRGPQVIPQMQKAGYTDVLDYCGIHGGDTFLPAQDNLRIDYIWVNAPLIGGIHHAEIWQETPGQEASDHRPVLAELEI